MELNKKERARLREIVAECHEQHLEDLLQELYEDFQKWGGKYIDAFELSNRIHKFHDSSARDLYKMYVLAPPEVAIIYALRNNIIGLSGIDESITKKLNIKIELLENRH